MLVFMIEWCNRRVKPILDRLGYLSCAGRLGYRLRTPPNKPSRQQILLHWFRFGGGEKEAAPGLEPGNRGFADLCLTTWLCRLNYKKAGNETRTRDSHLGKVVLYQLSYSRLSVNIRRPISQAPPIYTGTRGCQHFSPREAISTPTP